MWEAFALHAHCRVFKLCTWFTLTKSAKCLRAIKIRGGYMCVCNWLDVYMWHCMSDLTVSLEHVAPNEKVINGNVSHYLKQVSSRHKVLLKSPFCSNMVSYSWRAQVWSAIFIHKSKDWFEPMFFFFSFFFFYSQNVWINSLKMKYTTQLLLVFHS